MGYSLTLSRVTARRRDQKDQLTEFSKALRSSSLKRWRVSRCAAKPDPDYDATADKFTYRYKLHFEKQGGKMTADVLAKEWTKIVHAYQKIATAVKWRQWPWTVSEVMPELKSVEDQLSGSSEDEAEATKAAFGLPKKLLSLAEVRENCLPQIDQMLSDSSKLHSVFHGLFDREPQIRTVLSSVKSFLTTDGQRRNHVLLYGLPACAKTQILLRLRDFLGDGAVARLDATNMTQAGISKLYLDDVNSPVPPFIFIEEIEKTAEEVLRIFLGMLDDRGEIRKTNFNMNLMREVRVLGMATANDKVLLDRLMGGSGTRPGALSSRFVNQLYCPRPDRRVLELILRRDIGKCGGNELWIEPALKLAQAINTNDPRKVLAFLDGADRLLTGEYQDDILKVMEKETEEMHQDPSHVDVASLNELIGKEMAA